MNRKYPIAYKVDFGDHADICLKEAKMAGADELLICSVVRFPDGKGTIAWHSTNGKLNESMKTSAMFSAWLALAANIAMKNDLNNSQREVILSAINNSRTKTEKL